MRWLLPVVLAAACGSTSASPATEQKAPPATDQDGYLRGGAVVEGRPEWRVCGPECLAAHARACEAGAKVWKVDVAVPNVPVHTFYVSSTRIARVDTSGRSYVGIDANVWTTCTDCGGGLTCHPTTLAFTLQSLDDDATVCTRETLPAGDPWHGLESVREQITCGEARMEMTSVPALAEVRTALQAVGLVPEDDPLPSGGGLVVGGAFQGQSFEMVGSVTEASCADLALPADARNVADLDAYGRLDATWRKIFEKVAADHPVKKGDIQSMLQLVDAANVALCREYTASP